MELTEKELDAKLKEASEKATVKATKDAGDVVREEFKDYKKPEDVDKLVADAEEKAIEDYKNEVAKVDERVKVLAEAKIEVTDYRRNRIKEIPFTEEGDKDFAAFVDDLKKDRKEVASKPKKNFKPELAGEGNVDLSGAH